MGGDPTKLTLRGFLDAAYALLIEEYGRMGVGLSDALDQTAMWRAGAKDEKPKKAEEIEAENVAKQNTQALQQLKTALAGTQGAPRV